MPIIKLCAFYSCKQNEDNIEEMDRLVDSATCFIFPRANSLSELSFLTLLISSLLFIPIRHTSQCNELVLHP